MINFAIPGIPILWQSREIIMFQNTNMGSTEKRPVRPMPSITPFLNYILYTI